VIRGSSESFFTFSVCSRLELDHSCTPRYFCLSIVLGEIALSVAALPMELSFAPMTTSTFQSWIIHPSPCCMVVVEWHGNLIFAIPKQELHSLQAANTNMYPLHPPTHMDLGHV